MEQPIFVSNLVLLWVLCLLATSGRRARISVHLSCPYLCFAKMVLLRLQKVRALFQLSASSPIRCSRCIGGTLQCCSRLMPILSVENVSPPSPCQLLTSLCPLRSGSRPRCSSAASVAFGSTPTRSLRSPTPTAVSLAVIVALVVLVGSRCSEARFLCLCAGYRCICARILFCVMRNNDADAHHVDWPTDGFFCHFPAAAGQNVHKLIKNGFIIRKPQVVHSRARANRHTEAKRKGRHTGFGVYFSYVVSAPVLCPGF